jgi:hypothetical protein
MTDHSITIREQTDIVCQVPIARRTPEVCEGRRCDFGFASATPYLFTTCLADQSASSWCRLTDAAIYRTRNPFEKHYWTIGFPSARC